MPGPAFIFKHPDPPHFFINGGELWQVTNQTSMLQVNVLNVTGTTVSPDLHYKLSMGTKQEGLGGSWRWRGTMLHYDLGKRTNKGLFYFCQTEGGDWGVFLKLEP